MFFLCGKQLPKYLLSRTLAIWWYSLKTTMSGYEWSCFRTDSKLLMSAPNLWTPIPMMKIICFRLILVPCLFYEDVIVIRKSPEICHSQCRLFGYLWLYYNLNTRRLELYFNRWRTIIFANVALFASVAMPSLHIINARVWWVRESGEKGREREGGAAFKILISISSRYANRMLSLNLKIHWFLVYFWHTS